MRRPPTLETTWPRRLNRGGCGTSGWAHQGMKIAKSVLIPSCFAFQRGDNSVCSDLTGSGADERLRQFTL